VLKGPVKDCLWRICGAEYATPPFMAPELFARFFTPYATVYCRMMREAGVYPRIHSHGRVGRVLDEIVKCGAAALDPVEPPPDGDITIAEIKKRTGNRLCLMGGIELKHLEAAGGDFVENLIRDLVAQGKPGGNYVIMPTAAPINIPLRQKSEDNYKRFIETALECGKY
jgi:uroporphyrinogen-III decarboxylase